VNTGSLRAQRAGGSLSASLRWYLCSIAAFLVPGGINMVLFPALVTLFLAESAERVGIAQMAGQLPSLALVLVGGVIGDRFDQRRVLTLVHVLAALPPLVLAVAIATGQFDYSMLLVYAFVWGTMGALAQPTRDALLSRVAGDQVQRTVSIVMGLQFVAQIVGFAIGSLAGRVGPVAVLIVQALAMAAGALAVRRIDVPAHVHAGPRPAALRAIAEGFAWVRASREVLPVSLLNLGVGLFFAGTFVVLVPLTIRDVYGGGPADIALALFAHTAGTVTMISALVVRGGIVQQGRALVLSLLLGAAVLLPLCFGVPLDVFYLLMFLWGLGAGVAMTMSRTIAQEMAPPSHRARVMSVLSLAGMGSMPFGSLLIGYAVGAFGPMHAAWVPVLGVSLLTALVALRTDVWRILPPPVAERV
jgi:MFS family permease